MVFAVAALLFQFTPIFQALPAAIPATPAATASAADAREPKYPDTPVNISMNVKLTADLSSAHFEKDSASSTASSSTRSFDPAPITSAENSQSLASIRIPAFEPAKQNPIIRAESTPSRRTWLALAFVEHGAAAFDAYSTRDAISRGATEADPIMRPFVHSPGLYAAIQVGPVLFDFVSRKMQRSQNNYVRHMWWLPQSVSTATSIFSGVHNLNVAGHP
jgi:hypothetical protein